MIDKDGNLTSIRLGRNIQEGEVLQFVVPANCWFASEPAPGTDFSLVGCTVSPGFDFADFDMADADTLIIEYPQHSSILLRLCK